MWSMVVQFFAHVYEEYSVGMEEPTLRAPHVPQTAVRTSYQYYNNKKYKENGKDANSSMLNLRGLCGRSYSYRISLVRT
jgi:hypothetical protein